MLLYFNFTSKMPSHLGIDIGTTSVKVCIVRDGKKIDALRISHDAMMLPNSDHPAANLFDEQNPKRILEVLDQCIQQLNHLTEDVSEIFVTGQMHGVILWKGKTGGDITDVHLLSIYDEIVNVSSNLITWQDKRCDSSFLNQFPPSPLFCKISTGFGIATLAWIQKEYKNLNEYNMCGTIMDFLTWLLTESSAVVMTSHNANSWGYFDIDKGNWEFEKIQELGLDTNMLPKIVPVSDQVGKLKWPLHGLNANVIVHAALGDMQCSIRAMRPSPTEAVIHIGTSSQLSFIAQYDETAVKNVVTTYPGISIVPFRDGDIIFTAASLSGGNVINHFVTHLQSWMEELGCENIPSKENMFKRLQYSAVRYKENRNLKLSCLDIIPRIYGERFDPESTGSVSNINSSNCTLGGITSSIYEGLIRNLIEILPVDLMKMFGIDGVVVTGGAFDGNNILKELVLEICELKVRSVNESDDASFGVILFQNNTIGS